MRLNSITHPCLHAFSHTPGCLFDSKIKVLVFRDAIVPNTGQSSHMFAVECEAKFERALEHIAIRRSYLGARIVGGVLGGIVANLKKDVRCAKLGGGEVFQYFSGIQVLRGKHLGRREMRAARKKADVYRIKAEQLQQPQCYGPFHNRKGKVRAGEIKHTAIPLLTLSDIKR